MSKKFFIGLFLISLIVLNGGCGGSSNDNPVTPATNVNEALKGAWTSSSNGTSTITGTNADSDDLNAFVEAFGEIPDEVLEQYETEQKNKTVETVNAPVTRVMAVFEDCDIAESNGTVKFTAIVIISDDSSLLPILFNGVALSTQRNNTNEWTATTPDGDTLSINMASEEKINLSGKIHYLDYDCEFNTVIDKNQSNSIEPGTILNGTWNLDGTQSGGYLDENSETLVIPEAVSMFFKDTGEENSAPKSTVSSFYSLRMKTSSNENDEETSLLQNINPDTEGTLTQIFGNVYKFTETNGIESIIFVENTDEIFMFRTESDDNSGQSCMFLPLKKVSFDIEAAMKKNWTASDGDGGGYIKLLNLDADDDLLDFFNLIDNTFSLTLKSGTINFSDVTLNDDGTITTTIGLDTMLSFTNKLFAIFGVFPISDESEVTMTRSGNFLQFENEEDGAKSIYKLSFISDTELFLYTKLDGDDVQGEFAMRFTAAN